MCEICGTLFKQQLVGFGILKVAHIPENRKPHNNNMHYWIHVMRTDVSTCGQKWQIKALR